MLVGGYELILFHFELPLVLSTSSWADGNIKQQRTDMGGINKAACSGPRVPSSVLSPCMLSLIYWVVKSQLAILQVMAMRPFTDSFRVGPELCNLKTMPTGRFAHLPTLALKEQVKRG